MRIVFKTGQVLEDVDIEIATIIRDSLLKPEGAKNFQCFSDKNNKLLSIINVSEILYIK